MGRTPLGRFRGLQHDCQKWVASDPFAPVVDERGLRLVKKRGGTLNFVSSNDEKAAECAVGTFPDEVTLEA